MQQLRWHRGSVLAFGTQVCGFKPGRSRRIFKGNKILSMPSFGGEVKLLVPYRRFAVCKRSLNVTWKSTFRQNYQPRFLPTQFHLSLLGSSWVAQTRRTDWWRKWECLKKGSTISLLAAVHLGCMLQAQLKKKERGPVQTQPLREMSTRNIGLTTLPPSCADCLEIRKPQPPGTLRACPGL
jgi:hypothetical protein